MKTPNDRLSSLAPPGTKAVLVAFLLALAASGVVLFAPLTTTETEVGSETTSLLEEEPGAALGVSAVALGLTVIPLLLNGSGHVRRFRSVSAVLLLLGSLAAILSVGALYLPSALAMVVGALRAPRYDTDRRLGSDSLPNPG